MIEIKAKSRLGKGCLRMSTYQPYYDLCRSVFRLGYIMFSYCSLSGRTVCESRSSEKTTKLGRFHLGNYVKTWICTVCLSLDLLFYKSDT